MCVCEVRLNEGVEQYISVCMWDIKVVEPVRDEYGRCDGWELRERVEVVCDGGGEEVCGGRVRLG